MRIRPCSFEDRADWLRMRCALWPAESPGELAAEIDAWPSFEETPVFVAEADDGAVVGLAEATIHAHAPGCTTQHIGFLEAWYVDEPYRKRGVGKALHDAVEQWARRKGCTEMASDTTPDYPHSRAAHRAIGYLELGESMCFYKTL